MPVKSVDHCQLRNNKPKSENKELYTTVSHSFSVNTTNLMKLLKGLLNLIITMQNLEVLLVHIPNFWGCQGRRTRVRVTIVSNSLILGGRMTKDLKNGDEK